MPYCPSSSRMAYQVTVRFSLRASSAPCRRNASTSASLPGFAFSDPYSAYCTMLLPPHLPEFGYSLTMRDGIPAHRNPRENPVSSAIFASFPPKVSGYPQLPSTTRQKRVSFSAKMFKMQVATALRGGAFLRRDEGRRWQRVLHGPGAAIPAASRRAPIQTIFL